MSENDTPIERAVELLVYAPIGLAMFAKDTMPTFLKMFVSRGQTEVTKHRKTAEQQAGQYRTIGHFAVKYGGPEVQRRAGGALDSVRKVAEDTLGTIAAAAATKPIVSNPRPTPYAAPSSQPAPSSRPAPVAPAPGAADAPDLGALPIPGYDLLSATQVIERLEGLSQPDLIAIRAYEITHRARTTILGKISQLAG